MPATSLGTSSGGPVPVTPLPTPPPPSCRKKPAQEAATSCCAPRPRPRVVPWPRPLPPGRPEPRPRAPRPAPPPTPRGARAPSLRADVRRSRYFPHARPGLAWGRGAARSAHAPQRQRSPRIVRGLSLSAGAGSARASPLAPARSRRHAHHHRAGVRGVGYSASLAVAVLGESRTRAAVADLLRDPGSCLARRLPPASPASRLSPLARGGSGGAGRVRGAPALTALLRPLGQKKGMLGLSSLLVSASAVGSGGRRQSAF